jgi:hypothetical protein
MSKDIDAWLALRKQQLKHAQVNVEYARAAMVKAGRTASSTRSFAVGDQVKVSTRVLPQRVTSTQ